MKTSNGEVSSELVRTLLKAQDEWDAPMVVDNSPRKRQRKSVATSKSVVDESDRMRYHVRSILALDRSLAAGINKVPPLDDRHRRQMQAAQALVHSRSRATVPEPTFNKDKYAKEKKEASLQKIARRLAAHSKRKRSNEA